MGYGDTGWGWGGMIGMVLLWVVLIALIVWAVTRLLPTRRLDGGYQQASRETPEEILDRRFARGEVELETYQAQRATLKSSRGER